MKIIIACLLTLALLLVGVSTFLNFSRFETEKESVKDTTVDKDQNNKDETPSDEPMDEPSDEPVEEVPTWTAVELTDITKENHGISFGVDFPDADKVLKFTVDKPGVFALSHDGSYWMTLVDYSTKKCIKTITDKIMSVALEPGVYAVGTMSDVQVYFYTGDFSECEQSVLNVNSGPEDSLGIDPLNDYCVMKLVLDGPTEVTSVEFGINIPFADESVTLDVYKNDGNGTLYFLIPNSSDLQINALFVSPSVFGSEVTSFEAYGITVSYEENEAEAFEVALTTLSMRSEVVERIEEPELTESSEIISWSDVNGQEIVEYSDGRTFINGVEVQWSDVTIVG